MANLLVIDNYDSFTYNLVQMFMRYDLSIRVFRSDQITLGQMTERPPDYILISPGPKDPQHAGISMTVIETFYRTTPILGVCLGMQCINEVFGGSTVRAGRPLHGQTSALIHDGMHLFTGIPSPFRAARYHSLVVAPAGAALQTELEITGRTRSGTIMGLSHRCFPLHGVQFHPESFLTDHGYIVIENFLRLGPLGDMVSDQALTRSANQLTPMRSGAAATMQVQC